MVRNAIAVLGGLMLGGVANSLVILVGMSVWPPAADLDFTAPNATALYVASLPTAALLLAVFAHLCQPFLGAWFAARYGEDDPMHLALGVGGIALLGGVANLLSMRPPMWMWFELPLFLVVAAAAGKIEVNRRIRQGEPAAES